MALPGAPSFEDKRVHMARVRGRSLLWRRVPGETHRRLVNARKKNDNYKDLVTSVRGLIRKYKERRVRREMLLREGYLWADDVELGLALVEQISLLKLFGKQTVFLQRGVDIYKAKYQGRTKLHHARHVYVGGPYDGERAEILLGDRVATLREELGKGRAAGGGSARRHGSRAPSIASVRFTSAQSRWSPSCAMGRTDGSLHFWASTGLSLDVVCEAHDASSADKKRSFEERMSLLRGAMTRGARRRASDGPRSDPVRRRSRSVERLFAQGVETGLLQRLAQVQLRGQAAPRLHA